MSVLPKQIVQVLLKGLNQKDPSTIGVPGGLEIAENVRIDRGQESGFEFVRRNGLVEVADLPVVGGQRMIGFAGGIVVDGGLGDGSIVPATYKYDPGTQVFKQLSDIQRGLTGIVRSDLQVSTLYSTGGSTPNQTGLDVAFAGDLGCYVWADQSGLLKYTVRNRLGSVLASGGIATVSATRTRVVALGSNWYLFWKEANAIKGAVVSGSTYAVGAPVTVIAAGGALALTPFDVIAGFDATHIALLYRSAAGTYVRCLLSTALAVGTTVSDATAANQPDTAFCWHALDATTLTGGSLVYATLNAANGLKIQTINNSTLAITGTISQATAPVTGVQSMTGGRGVSVGAFVLICRSITDADGVAHGIVDYVDQSRVVGPYESGASLISRVGFLGSTPVAALLYVSNQASGTVAAPQSYIKFLNVLSPVNTAFLPVSIAKALVGGAASQLLTTLSADSTGALHGVFAKAIFADTKSGTVTIVYGMSDVSLSLNPSWVGPPLAFGGVALLPGGEVWEVDNSAAVEAGANYPLHEHGFRSKPEIPVLVEGAAASGSIAPGVRSYVVRFKWIDAGGQVYRSATSTPVAITTANVNSSVSVKFWAPNAGSIARRYVQAEVLRTPASGTGDIYYRVSQAVYTVDALAQAVTVFVDSASEATLLAGEPWEPATELENVAPPALNDVIEHKNRAFGIDAEQPWRIRFSKEYTPGTSVGFTDAFIVETPDSTGPIYKLMSMDGHLIAIKKDTIYAWAGDFPDNTGAGEIPSATALPVGVGSEQPRSVVLTDLGIIFYSSRRGFWLLNRSLGVEYIGAPVETTAAGQTVSGATVHPTYTEVRFTTEGGTTFVLNTHFTRVAGSPIWTTLTGQACVHSIVHAGDWYLLTSDGKLKKEDRTRWQDGSTVSGSFVAGTAYTSKVKISDINFAGIGGLARIWRGQLLGLWYSSHKVKITLGLNHRSVAGQVFNFDATNDPDPYQLEFRLNAYESKQTSMSVTIEDTADFQNQGFAWDALMFTVGAKGGLYRRGKNFAMVGS